MKTRMMVKAHEVEVGDEVVGFGEVVEVPDTPWDNVPVVIVESELKGRGALLLDLSEWTIERPGQEIEVLPWEVEAGDVVVSGMSPTPKGPVLEVHPYHRLKRTGDFATWGGEPAYELYAKGSALLVFGRETTGQRYRLVVGNHRLTVERNQR